MGNCAAIIRQQRIDALARLKAQREALDPVLSGTNEAQAYEMNDGQIKVKAERANFKDVQTQLDTIDAKIMSLELLLGICAVSHMRSV